MYRVIEREKQETEWIKNSPIEKLRVALMTPHVAPTNERAGCDLINRERPSRGGIVSRRILYIRAAVESVQFLNRPSRTKLEAGGEAEEKSTS